MNRLWIFFLLGTVLGLFSSGARAEGEARRSLWRVDASGGVQDYNYTATAPQAGVQLLYKREPRQFFLLGRFDYLDKFGDRAFSTTLGGGYWVHPKILLSDSVSFAPADRVVPKFQNVFELLGVLPRGFTPYLRYNYRFYRDASLHGVTPGLSWYVSSWGIFDANYTLSLTHLDGLPGERTDHAFSLRVTVIPWEDRLKFYAGYARGSESFDAGNALVFGRFHSNIVSAGAEWAIVERFGVRFDAMYENRDNGQTQHVYVPGVFYRWGGS